MKTMTQEGGLWQDRTSPLWTEWASRSPPTASGRMVRNGLWWNRYQKQLNEITIPKKLGCCVKHSHWFGIHRLPVWCYSSVVFQNNLLYHGSCSGEIDRFLLFGFEVRWQGKEWGLPPPTALQINHLIIKDIPVTGWVTEYLWPCHYDKYRVWRSMWVRHSMSICIASVHAHTF